MLQPCGNNFFFWNQIQKKSTRAPEKKSTKSPEWLVCDNLHCGRKENSVFQQHPQATCPLFVRLPNLRVPTSTFISICVTSLHSGRYLTPQPHILSVPLLCFEPEIKAPNDHSPLSLEILPRSTFHPSLSASQAGLSPKWRWRNSQEDFLAFSSENFGRSFMERGTHCCNILIFSFNFVLINRNLRVSWLW